MAGVAIAIAKAAQRRALAGIGRRSIDAGVISDHPDHPTTSPSQMR
jgi:hypothetical protein